MLSIVYVGYTRHRTSEVVAFSSEALAIEWVSKDSRRRLFRLTIPVDQPPLRAIVIPEKLELVAVDEEDEEWL